MKKLTFLLIAILALGFVSCKKDDEPSASIDSTLVGFWKDVDNCTDKNLSGKTVDIKSDGSMVGFIPPSDTTTDSFNYAANGKWSLKNVGLTGTYSITNGCLTMIKDEGGTNYYIK